MEACRRKVVAYDAEPMRRLQATSLAALAAGSLTLSACGSEGVDVPENSSVRRGAVLFAQRCGGCHTLDAAGTEGSSDRADRTSGPNFNQRRESVQSVLYAIRNGGFSSGPMPQDIVVGEQAEKVADFLAKYSGRDAERIPAPNQPAPSGF